MAVERAFDDYWDRTGTRLEAELPRWIRLFFDALRSSEQAAVHEALDGGKRVRGNLVCLVAEALGGTIDDALPRAVAIECVQAASLIHDDVVDGDAFRRGRPSVWAVRGRRRAVLLGDLIFATALRRMIELSRRDGIVLGGTIADMAAGAYHEPLASPEPVRAARPHWRPCEADLYPLIIYMKSGALFGAAARLGAHAAGCGEAAAELAFDYGVQIGEAYQIGDDLADLFDEAGDDRLEQLSLLEPLWRHFCAREVALPGGSAATVECDDALAARLNEAQPLLRERMRGAMGTRLRRAESTIERLAPGRHAELLRAAPAAIVRMTGG